MSLLLRFGLLASLAAALFFHSEPSQTALSGPAVRPPAVSHHSSQGRLATHGGARHPYWDLERKFVAQQHRMGRLGAEVRRLRRESKFRQQKLNSARRLQVHLNDPAGYAIRLAASAYHVSEAEMRTVASCETGQTFDPGATNPRSGASGLFQFLPSTWASQGLAGFSVYDPVANALAAARIVSREGWRQWECRP